MTIKTVVKRMRRSRNSTSVLRDSFVGSDWRILNRKMSAIAQPCQVAGVHPNPCFLAWNHFFCIEINYSREWESLPAAATAATKSTAWKSSTSRPAPWGSTGHCRWKGGRKSCHTLSKTYWLKWRGTGVPGGIFRLDSHIFHCLGILSSQVEHNGIRKDFLE